MIGETLGSYRLIEKLGEGGMGEVYRALDEMLDRDVALKMLKPELARRQSTVDRFRAEAITLAKLDHPGIARIYGCSRHDDRWFMVMEFVRGETLLGRLHRAGRLPWAEAVPIVCQLLDALEYAHRRGVIHRDMKPANVLMGVDGAVKVTDFGIARVLGTERATRTGHVVGTLEYMSPEQVRGEEVDGRADLYAVGIVLFQLLTGRVPFRGTAEYDVMMQHLQAPVPSARDLAPEVPAWFDEVLQRALAKALPDRFPSAAAFQVAIEGLASTEPAMRIKATRLANAAMDAAVVGATGALPRATDPQAVSPTLPGLHTAPTVLGPQSRPVTAASPAEPATTHLASTAPATPVPPPLPPVPALSAGAVDSAMAPPIPPVVAAPAAPGVATGHRGITGPRIAAAGALAVVLLAAAVAGIWSVSRHRTDATPADGPNVAARPVPAPEPPVIEAPAPTIAATTPSPEVAAPPAVDPAPPLRQPRSSTPPAGALPPTSTAPAPPPVPADAAPDAAEPAPAPAPVPMTPPVAAPRAEAAATIEFDEVGLMTMAGDELEEHEIVLRFEADRLVLFDEDSEAAVRTLPYPSVADATYARSKRPIGKAERDAPTLIRGVARGGGLFRRTPHWLTLEAAGATIMLKVDGDDAERVVSTIEARTPARVVRVSEK